MQETEEERRERLLKKQDDADIEAWKSPGGWIFELFDERLEWKKLEDAAEEREYERQFEDEESENSDR